MIIWSLTSEWQCTLYAGIWVYDTKNADHLLNRVCLNKPSRCIGLLIGCHWEVAPADQNAVLLVTMLSQVV